MSTMSRLVRAENTIARPEGSGPRVHFDTQLGKLAMRGKQIDIDTTAYATHLESQGLTGEQIDNADVRFNYAPVLGHVVKAGYDYETRKIDVNVTPFTRSSTMNKAIHHESEHYRTQAVKEETSRRYRIATNLADVTSAAGGLTAAAMGVAGRLMETDALQTPSLTGAAIAAGALVTHVAMYYGRAEERRALHAGSHGHAHGAQIARFV